ncbi:MAG: hypothetical protein WC496_04720 [Phycisphaerae bacterium]|jgi:hypothetical protein
MIRNLLMVILLADFCFGADSNILKPVIDGQWRQIAGNPDLGIYTGEKQEPVDFAVWQAADGTWQLWSCIRGAKLDGHNRLFYRWEGKHITDANWTPVGIAMMSNAEFGEPLNGLQAPYVVRYKNRYWMFYGDWNNICLATSKDGKTFERVLDKNKTAAVFSEGGEEVNTRDPMLLWTKDKWYCYYTACPGKKGYMFCRTSRDLLNWSDSMIVAYGGSSGNGWASSECPQVIEPKPGCYYLFRNQYYGPGAQVSVYFSNNPLNFGIDDDSYFVCKFNLAAPEIVKDDDQYYIVALNLNLDGIRIARLKWE